MEIIDDFVIFVHDTFTTARFFSVILQPEN